MAKQAKKRGKAEQAEIRDRNPNPNPVTLPGYFFRPQNQNAAAFDRIIEAPPYCTIPNISFELFSKLPWKLFRLAGE